MSLKKNINKFNIVITVLGVSLLILGLMTIANNPVNAKSGLHPVFPFLDKDGDNVLESGRPVSTMNTCGQCHDTNFIESHSYHVDIGFSNQVEAGTTSSERAWDTSSGLFGKWNPITYRYLSPAGDALVDLTLSEWAQTIGTRHVGGGPTEDLGTEMNCFICHLDNPDNDARIEAVQNGDFESINTATLISTGIVNSSETGFEWMTDAFDEDGNIKSDVLEIQGPEITNCGYCHGSVDDDIETPIKQIGCNAQNWTTQTTGQIMSPQRISESALNLENKDSISRPWDVHIERMVDCADCHYSLNNPILTANETGDLEHLEFDPRRLDIGEYLYQPDHNFAHGTGSQSDLNIENSESIRTCEYCHEVEQDHSWLPYQDEHLETLNCETCHIPQMYSTARMQFDWTVINVDSYAITDCRGDEGSDENTASSLITGFTPVVMTEVMPNGDEKLSPYNLISAWFWVYGEPERPVRLEDLEKVFLVGGEYTSEIIAEFDADGNGSLTNNELRIDSDEKQELIVARLEALGLDNPRITAEIQPYSINHNVVDGEWVTKECQACHSDNSLLSQPMQLASYLPGDVYPEFVKGTNTITDGDIYLTEDGNLYFQPNVSDDEIYVFGKDNISWIDWYGLIAVVGVLGVLAVHGGIRVMAARKAPKTELKTKSVYMYSFYERLWHWLQTIAILTLAITGFVIHKPDMFTWINFKGVVYVHNIIAGILATNAALALFYNLVSGDIKRFIPEPKGIFNQTFEQIKYYTVGIFKGEDHPIEKTRSKRLNVLQKMTYFGILNILLPLQGITGLLMWGAGRVPEVVSKLGGLPFLAPFHTLVAWTFVAFMIGHVYLTTTGAKPMSGISAMIVGYEDVEEHSQNGSEE